MALNYLKNMTYKLKIIKWLVLLQCFISCNERLSNNKISESDSTELQHNSNRNNNLTNTSVNNEIHISDKHINYTTLNFGSFTVTLNQEYNSDYLKSKSIIKTDTVILNASLETDIKNEYITLLSDNLTNYSITQSCETSISIMNEGAHCDLTSWAHVYANWTPLQINKSGKYMCMAYSEKAISGFPTVNMDSLKAHVRKHCGIEWVNVIQDVKSLNDYPITIGINRYFFKINGLSKGTNIQITKLIIIEMPMGC